VFLSGAFVTAIATLTYVQIERTRLQQQPHRQQHQVLDAEDNQRYHMQQEARLEAIFASTPEEIKQNVLKSWSTGDATEESPPQPVQKIIRIRKRSVPEQAHEQD